MSCSLGLSLQVVLLRRLDDGRRQLLELLLATLQVHGLVVAVTYTSHHLYLKCYLKYLFDSLVYLLVV